MTNAHALTLGQSPVSAIRIEAALLVNRARVALAHYIEYRRTLAELRQLPSRALRDLGFDRADLNAVARGAVYGR